MKRVLAAAQADMLARFAASRVLLAFDFDGTLAPIVAHRDEALLRGETRALLARVCALYPCVVLSGRGREDVERRLEGLAFLHIVGNHGLDAGEAASRFERETALLRPRLAAALQGWTGVEIEDKRFSLAVHYRNAPGKGAALRAIREAAAGLARGDAPIPVRVVAGKLVVDVLPGGVPHKGDALRRLRAREGADTAIYVGDDVTDEDVFAMDEPGRLLSIRVGRSGSSAAGYYLRDQPEMDAFLARLAALRGSP